MNKTFLDKDGLQVVADNTNLRVKIVTEVPSAPRNDMVILYNGANTTDFAKGGIYKYNDTEWESFGGSAEQIYDATSENAQSGKAVEQAVEEFIMNNTGLYAEPYTWSGEQPTNFYGLWKDPDGTVYYSYGSDQYILNKSTSTWETKTWYGVNYEEIDFNGQNIWNDGENVYFTNEGLTLVLNKATSTWTEKTWHGTYPFFASYVWKDPDGTVYYSDGWSAQLILDKATDTWEEIEWGPGYDQHPDGHSVWNDGENVYLGIDAVLDRETKSWKAKEFIAPFSWIDPNYLHSDGNNYYYSPDNDSYSYKFNRFTLEWIATNRLSAAMWNDGKNIYSEFSSIFHRKFNTLIK